jgi:hypothetical protein
MLKKIQETKSVIKIVPSNQAPAPDRLMAKFSIKHQELTTNLLKLFQITEEGTLSSTFYEATITLIPRLDKVIIRKEYFKPNS